MFNRFNSTDFRDAASVAASDVVAAAAVAAAAAASHSSHAVTTSHPHFPVPLPPYTVLLKDGETTATIYPIHSPQTLPPGLLAFLADEFNMEIERGDTFPFFDTLDIEEFRNYWFGSFAAVMVLGDDSRLEHQRSWEKECLGSFFIKANYPGRSSHICTGGFLVNAGIRGKGIGKTLVECYLDWAPKLGYTSSVFNLIFETNVGARRIFESLNFKRVGKIKAAGILKDHDNAVDALIYGKELVHPQGGDNHPHQGTFRFDKIKYYLETGRYPPLIDRQEKSRLRSSASHYKLADGKLTLNGKEVVSDPIRQLEICTEYHNLYHGGINKTTTLITERYHWTRIKDTVAQALRNCNECRDPSKSSSNLAKRKLVNNNHHNHGLEKINDNRSNEIDLHTSNELETLSQHLQRSNDPNLLQDSDFTNIDDPSSLIAAVEAAQRRSQQQQQQVQSHQRIVRDYEAYTHLQQPQSVNVQQQNNNDQDDIPVDPEVSAFDDPSGQYDQRQYEQHVQEQVQQQYQEVVQVDGPNGPNGEEIEIARALIQANGDQNSNGQVDDNEQDQLFQ